jgi:nucleoside-diphosphate-sugar epimerase
MSVSGKKIIITGVNGSLGKQLVLHFSKSNSVIGIARQAEPAKEITEHCSYIHADINDLKYLPNADILIHAAGFSDDKGSRDKFYRDNVLGTENIARLSKNVKNFIFISSSSVYLPSPERIPESEAERNGLSGLSEYGKSKWLAEKRLREISQHKSCFILRPRALYGVGDTKIIPRMLRLVHNGTLTIPGTMKLRVSLTHFENMMHSIECCLNSEFTGIHTYNIADDETYILINCLRLILENSTEKIPKEKHIPVWILRLLGTFHLAGMSPLLVRTLTRDMELDLTKIKNELNYSPVWNLEKKIHEIGAWIKQMGGVESDFFQKAH